MTRHLPTMLSLMAALAVVAATLAGLKEPPRGPPLDSPLAPPLIKEESADVHGGTVPGRDNVSHEFRAEVSALRQRLTESPEDTLALVRLGNLLQMAHRPAEAVPLLESYTAINKGNREAWFQLATSYGTLNQWDKAMEVMTTMLATWPDDAQVMYNVGAIHANQGEYEEARQWWERVRAQRKDPTVAEAATTALRRLPPSSL